MKTIILLLGLLLASPVLADDLITIRDKDYVAQGYIRGGKIYDKDYVQQGYITKDGTTRDKDFRATDRPVDRFDSHRSESGYGSHRGGYHK